MPATDKFWRDLKMMHIVFALSCIALFGATFWMMAEDHSAEWRPYQQKFDRIVVQKNEQEKQELETTEFDSRRNQLQEEIEAADSEIKQLETVPLGSIDEEQVQAAVDNAGASERTLADVRQEVADLQFVIDGMERRVKAQRAFRDVARANFDLGIRDNLPQPQLNALQAKFDEEQRKVDEQELAADEKDLELQKLRAIVKAVESQRTTLKAEQQKLLSDLDQIQAATDLIAPESAFSAAKRRIMDWYIIDGFNSPHKVQQDWIPELHVKLGMSEISRFDRCRTCHVAIDKVEAGNVPAYPFGHPDSDDIDGWVVENEFPHPFATHPRPDVYLTASSPHPVSTFGCTVCHEGQGSGTSFNNAEHTPNNPFVQEEWEAEYDFHANHFWEYPMLPERFEESSCLKCHHKVTELGVNAEFGATAPKVHDGFQLIKTYGCFGCHEINGYDAGESIGPDIRLEPQTPEEAAKIAADPTLIPGQMRKVGPSLRHIASKTTPEWIEYWTEEPQRFRPTTRMPQFFHLTNQQDADAQRFMPVEIAGITNYLMKASEPLELLEPEEGYEPDAERGAELFSQRGCLACHQHEKFPDTTADFGPDLSKVHSKIKAGEEGFHWLYTWLNNPSLYHPRTKMPVLYLEAQQQAGQSIDPAADIAAFLLEGGPGDYPGIAITDEMLDALVREYLLGVLSNPLVEKTMTERRYPFSREMIKGDEIELSQEADDVDLSDEAWRQMKLNYVGRRTISRYGCYGCHDIAGFESSRPIGTALQDWGRKDTSKLALEHIEEYLHHHGEPFFGTDPVRAAAGPGVLLSEITASSPAARAGLKPGDRIVGLGEYEIDDVGDLEDAVHHLQSQHAHEDEVDAAEDHPNPDPSRILTDVTILRGDEEIVTPLNLDTSTRDRVVTALTLAESGAEGDDLSPQAEQELSAAYFYESLLHHGRPGFLWQKLRQPRSYDYEKIETKSYIERLRMPKFPFDETQIESIATFVLGLVAEPPPPAYVYSPEGPPADRIEGERLLAKYNCTGCHIVDLPQFKYAVDVDELEGFELSPDDFEAAVEALLQIKPPRNAETGEEATVDQFGEQVTLPVIDVHGLAYSYPDPEEDLENQEYTVDLWETIDVGDKRLLPTRLLIPASNIVDIQEARGGEFAEWLVEHQMQTTADGNRYLAWQMVPPPLYKEGAKVQTPWLYRFLLEPEKLRHTTVLRMPKFNMSREEAQSLANYFAAVDDVPYPYQPILERDPEYIALRNAELGTQPHSDSGYLAQSWKLLNAPLCIKCHSVGGREVKITDPSKDIRGPNLEYASDRLRPEWLLAWLFKPQWITPYTSMPQNFTKTKQQFEELLGGNGQAQTIAVRDALVNYHRLMEEFGKTVYDPQADSTATTGAGGD